MTEPFPASTMAMRRDGSKSRAALWRRRAAAAGVVTLFHLALFGLIARDWAMHRAPVRLDAVEVTLERPERPETEERPAEDRAPLDAPPPQIASPLPVAPSPGTGPPAATPVVTAGPAAPAPAGAPPPAGIVLNTGCLGRARELMTAAERRRCDQERTQVARVPAYILPSRLPPTALDREFAAALAKRRENDPAPRAARPTNCPLANITNCEPEDSTLMLFDGHGTGTAQVLKRRFTQEKLPEKPPAKAGPVFGREEITFTPIPMK